MLKAKLAESPKYDGYDRCSVCKFLGRMDPVVDGDGTYDMWTCSGTGLTLVMSENYRQIGISNMSGFGWKTTDKGVVVVPKHDPFWSLAYEIALKRRLICE